MEVGSAPLGSSLVPARVSLISDLWARSTRAYTDMPQYQAVIRFSLSNAGRGPLVHVGEKECNEYCREQRAARARSQALSGTSSGISMNRQGSVLVLYPPSKALLVVSVIMAEFLSVYAVLMMCRLCV